MKVPSYQDFDLAILRLERFKGTPAERERCRRMAGWLEGLLWERVLHDFARRRRVPVETARRRVAKLFHR